MVFNHINYETCMMEKKINCCNQTVPDLSAYYFRAIAECPKIKNRLHDYYTLVYENMYLQIWI